jgi:hypothetical protein
LHACVLGGGLERARDYPVPIRGCRPSDAVPAAPDALAASVRGAPGLRAAGPSFRRALRGIQADTNSEMRNTCAHNVDGGELRRASPRLVPCPIAFTNPRRTSSLCDAAALAVAALSCKLAAVECLRALRAVAALLCKHPLSTASARSASCRSAGLPGTRMRVTSDVGGLVNPRV